MLTLTRMRWFKIFYQNEDGRVSFAAKGTIINGPLAGAADKRASVGQIPHRISSLMLDTHSEGAGAINADLLTRERRATREKGFSKGDRQMFGFRGRHD